MNGDDRTTCVRCRAHYRPQLVDGCPVCGHGEVGIDEDARDRRILAMVVAAMAGNLLILAGIVIAVF